MKRPPTENYGVAASASASHTAHASRHASMCVAERSAAAAAKNGGFEEGAKEEVGARECMQMSRKFNTDGDE